MTVEITCLTSAAKAASFCAEAYSTIRLAQDLPQLTTAFQRLLRAQSLAHCLNSLASHAHFFHGPSLQHLTAYVIDWQASDEMCRDGEGLKDFCAELMWLYNQVDAALGRFEDERNYAPQPRGYAGTNHP